MIKPHDLMALAERLAAMQQEPGPAHLAVQREPEGRAAVSRAYYCAFHTAKSLIEDGCGVLLPTGPEAHEKLHKCLENSRDAVLAEIGSRLKSLRSERNRADYKLSDSKFAIAKNVQLQVTVAKQIDAEFKNTEARIPQFRANVQRYAIGTLKLTLVSKRAP
jgi:uncharacterized protein (UPF0332 family)